MRLYTNRMGEWYGTQADARKSGHDWVEVDVPTVKAELLAWLNDNKSSAQRIREGEKPIVAPYDPDAPVNQTREEIIQKYHPQGRPHPWTTIKECAEKASLKDLGVALSVLMNRLDEVADKQKEQSNDDS